MEHIEKNSAQIIGQIALMQSVIAQLPDIFSIMDFICRGFKDIPGIDNIDYIIPGLKKEHFITSDNEIYKYSIKYKDSVYAIIIISIKSKIDLDLYLPYIENFCGILGVVFEERHQRELNKELLSTLEQRVEERTRELVLESEHRKKTELSLIKSEGKLSFALKTSNSGIWDWDIITNEVIFDDNFYHISGYNPKDFSHSLTEWKIRIHPDDLIKMERAVTDYLDSTKETYRIEYRFKRKNGEWMWILAQGKIFSYRKNRLERFIGTHIDIDSQKRVEEKLLSATNYISNIIDSMPSILI